MGINIVLCAVNVLIIMTIFGHKLIWWPWSYKWSMCEQSCGHPNNNNSNNNYSYHNNMRKFNLRPIVNTEDLISPPFTSWVLEIWISIHNVIKDDNYAGEIVNKGALNIAFSRLNLHTQLIFVLATILTFQIINRTLKSLKLFSVLNEFDRQCLKHQKQIILTRPGNGETNPSFHEYSWQVLPWCFSVSVIFPIFGAVQFHPGP